MAPQAYNQLILR